MTARDVRRTFLEFFARHDHRIVSSSSLVPTDDPTLLFTNAGMNQFKDVFLDRERRDYVRAASAQKCMRVSGKHNDLANVGPSVRHHTFFEMLGNFSFGNYFKDEAITLAWTLLTEVWQLPPDRLRATIFGGESGIPRDDEACARWRRYLPGDRIDELGMAENFWAMGDTGPCGRCSEIHYLQDGHLPCDAPTCRGPACTCDRYIEIWNNVFMEFNRHADGTLHPLPSRSIDTGMGLERVTAVLQHVPSNYDTDLFAPLLEAISGLAGVAYGRDPTLDVSMRVVADHLRAITFLLGDEVTPSNEWRGYVLRKIIRRAMRHGARLGLTGPCLHRLVDVVVADMGTVYPSLQRRRETIGRIVRGEEQRFDAVLTAGLSRLEAALDQAEHADRIVPGADVFKLYDSLGLPVDFIEDLARERHLAIDRSGFDRLMQAQRQRARARSGFQTAADALIGTPTDDVVAELTAAGNRFEGYTATRIDDLAILMIWDAQGRPADALGPAQTGYLSLERTPFYVESGGQVSDTGWIYTPGGTSRAEVEAMLRRSDRVPSVHQVRVVTGSFARRDRVTAEVGGARRAATCRNHTATHLLHAALRQVLGAHVRQAGSLVGPDRLRFDFAHTAPLTPAQVDEVERVVQEQILRNTPVETAVRPTAEAIADGAMALFGEKYGARVRVVSVPGFSRELCGGTHCRATGEIGGFTIDQQSGTAAGIRRVDALTGEAALRRAQARRDLVRGLSEVLGTPEDRVLDVARRLHRDTKRLTRELAALRVRAALGDDHGAEASVDIDGVTLVARKTTGLDKDALRTLADSLKAKLAKGIVVLASTTGGRVAIVVSVTANLTERVHAGRVVKAIAPIVGGGGGGRPDFAEAGGKEPAKVDVLMAESQVVVRRMLQQTGSRS